MEKTKSKSEWLGTLGIALVLAVGVAGWKAWQKQQEREEAVERVGRVETRNGVTTVTRPDPFK